MYLVLQNQNFQHKSTKVQVTFLYVPKYQAVLVYY